MTDFPAAPPPTGAVSGPPATFGQRAIALIIDTIVSFALVLPGIVLVVIGLAIGGGFGGFLGLIGVLLVIAGFFVGLYVTIIAQGTTGQSPGKRMQGIQLQKGDTKQPVGVGLAIGRWLLAGLLSNFCYIGYLWMLFDPEKKTLYDKILSAEVVPGPKSGIMPLFPGGKPF